MPRTVVRLFVLLVAAAAPAAEARLHRYTVAVDPDISEIRVRACFDGTPPPYLVAESLDASRALERAQVEGGRRLEPNGAELKLGPLAPDACIAYTAKVDKFQGRHQRGGGPTRRVGPDLIAEVGVWLWRPPALAQDEDIEVGFALPEGISASAPWRPVRAADGSVSAYRLGHGPYDWPAAVAFGHFTEREIEVPGARLRVAVLHGSPEVEWDFVREWLTRAATAVTTLYGRFPVDTAQLIVVPNARGNEPVPSAYVVRGGMPSVHFFINQRKPLSAFLTDWSAVHELSHLLLPYVRPEDAWLPEGMASYYQDVLRARSGMVPAAEAWQHMHESFRRGMQSMPGVTLADATERMYRDGAYMRVYWSGAALMLLADQRLRSRSGGAQSLDLAFARLRECCLSPEAGWSARDLFAQLDRLTGTSVFTELHEEHVRSSRFPDLDECYRLLGLRPDATGERIELLEVAEQRAVRDAIMTSPQPVD
jgi:hypothetical protein